MKLSMEFKRLLLKFGVLPFVLVLKVLLTPSLEAAEAIRVVAFGDFGETSTCNQLEVAHAIEALQSGPKGVDFQFGLALGDNFYPDGVASVDDPQFQHKFIDVYRSLNIPFYLCLGNHDYGSSDMEDNYGNYLAQVLFSSSPDNPKLTPRRKKSSQSKSIKNYLAHLPPFLGESNNFSEPEPALLWNMPKRSYKKSLGKELDLFVLDTSPSQIGHVNYLKSDPKLGHDELTRENEKNWSRQLKDLAAELKESKARWKLVMGHHPIISDGKNNDSPELMGLGQDKRALHLRKILCEQQVSAYISGHEHSLQLLPISCRSYGKNLASIPQIISGAGGNNTMVRRFFEQRGPFQSTNLGFVTLEFSNSFILRFHELVGASRHVKSTEFNLTQGLRSL